MKKLNIAFLSYRSDPFSGGQGIYLKNVCESLANNGHKVTIYSGSPLPIVSSKILVIEVKTPQYFKTFSFSERVKIFKNQSKNLFEFQDFFEAITGNFSEPIFFGERLKRNNHYKENEDKYDIFHDNQSLSIYSSAIKSRLVTTLHHPIQIDRKIDLMNEKSILNKISINRWYSFLNFQQLNVFQSRLLITPSNNSKKDITKFFKYPSNQIEVLWNGINLDDFQFRKKKNFEKKLVTIISSDVPMKNLKNILIGFSFAQKKIEGLTLNIIGDVREQNIGLVDSLGLKDSVIIHKKPDKKKLIEILTLCDIGISGSLYEGFGFPLIEMIAIGLPVLASNKGSLPELMGNAGIAFNPYDPKEFSNSIQKLVSNNELKNKISNNCYKRRDDFFGWDEYAKKLEFLYQKIIDGHI